MEVERRKEVRFLQTTLIDAWGWFSKQYPTAASQWLRSDELTHWYLLNRACDLVYFGQRIANETFPQPTFSGAENLVSSLVSLLKDTEARLVKEKQREKDDKRRLEEAKKREEIAEECAEKIAKIAIRPPDNLDARVLSENELKTLTNACLRELQRTDQRDWDVNGTLKVVNECGEFCMLLKRPENHIKVPSGQCVEKQVNTRTYADMTHEMAQELSSLDPYTVYAKVIQEHQGTRLVIKRKIKTLRLPTPHLADLQTLVRSTIENTTPSYCKERSKIEEEIRQRQQNWLISAPGAQQEIRPSEEPPPTHY